MSPAGTSLLFGERLGFPNKCQRDRTRHRICVESVNELFLATGGRRQRFLWGHEGGTYVRLIDWGTARSTDDTDDLGVADVGTSARKSGRRHFGVAYDGPGDSQNSRYSG
jgi:hypothetical protein